MLRFILRVTFKISSNFSFYQEKKSSNRNNSQKESIVHFVVVKTTSKYACSVHPSLEELAMTLTKNCRELWDAESRRDSLPRVGSAHQWVRTAHQRILQYPGVSPKNTHATNIIQNDQVLIAYLGMLIYTE